MANISIHIGSTAPSDESCAQVGWNSYEFQARKEGKVFIEQLRRLHGPEPEGAHLYLKSNPHDYGTYLSVECRVDEDNEKAYKYALWCEAQDGGRWDKEARAELGIKAAV